MNASLPLLFGLSGASGVFYAVRLLEYLSTRADLPVHLIMTEAARKTVELELKRDPAELEALADVAYDPKDLAAAPSSGSFKTRGMLVLPCSMASLAKIAHGLGDNLLCRAADVTLKENRTLVLAPRETPLSRIHLRNLNLAAEAGALICPPMPAFYHQPTSLEQMVDQSLGKMLDLFGIEHQLFKRWGS